MKGTFGISTTRYTPALVLCAIVKANNIRSCEGYSLLMKLLRTELGFPGFNFLDTNGQYNARISLTNGLDYSFAPLWTNSTIDVYLKMRNLKSRLNNLVLRNLIHYCHAKLDDGLRHSIAKLETYVDVRGNHAKQICPHGVKSKILSKSVDNALPLKKAHKGTIFGSQGRPAIAGLNMASC